MTDITAATAPEISVLPIHFDVPGHYLALETFIETARQTKGVIDGFNADLFGGKLHYELFILPPEDGSFKSKIGIAVVCGVVWAFAESDIGKAFIRGLTTHEPSYWSEQAGTYLRSQLDKMTSEVEAGGQSSSDDEFSQRDSEIIVDMTRSFMQKDQSELSRIGITAHKFRECFEARNEFYKACLESDDVRALGFEDEENFPIKRKDFARLQVALQPREEQLVSAPWQVEIAVLSVTSPNWDKEDRQRPWKARDQNNRDRYFRIDDQHFWALVQAKKLDPHIIDTIKVQWAYHKEGSQRRDIRVVKVLEYNEQKLADALDDNALSAILGLFDQTDHDTPDLFGR